MPDATPARLHGRMPWTVALGAILITAALTGAAHATRIAATPRAEVLSRTSWMEADSSGVGSIGLLPVRMAAGIAERTSAVEWFRLDSDGAAAASKVELGVAVVITRLGGSGGGGPPREALEAMVTAGRGPAAASEYPRLLGADTLCMALAVTPGRAFSVFAELHRVPFGPNWPTHVRASTVRTFFCGLPEGARVVSVEEPAQSPISGPYRAIYR